MSLICYHKTAERKEVGVSKNGVKIIALMISMLSIGVKTHAYEEGDFQIWNTNEQEVVIGKATKFKMQEEFRYGDSASELFYQHYDWGFGWAFDKALVIDLGYRLVLEKSKNKWMESDEPYTNITPKFNLGKLRIEDRNRIEYRHFRFADDHVRYRNRFMLKHPFDFKTMKISPYISDEIFLSSNGRGFNQNRLEQGLDFDITKYVTAGISYMLQSVRGKGNKWSKANVLWFKLKIVF